MSMYVLIMSIVIVIIFLNNLSATPTIFQTWMRNASYVMVKPQIFFLK